MRRLLVLIVLVLTVTACTSGGLGSTSTVALPPDGEAWFSDPQDIAVLADGGLVVASWVEIAYLDGTGNWDLLTGTHGLPKGTGLDGWPGRTITHIATGGDRGLSNGELWAAGYATSPGDDPELGGTIDSWSGGRFLSWIARYECSGSRHCRWNASTGNEIPGMIGDFGDVVVGDDGQVYASAGDNVLLVFDGYSWTSHIVPGLSTGWNGSVSPWSSSLAIGADGVLWAATNAPHPIGRGLYSFDGMSFTQHTTADGLPSDLTFQVAAAPDGTIWVATDAFYSDPAMAAPDKAAGIARFDGSVWTTYTMTDGLLSNDAALAVSSDGTVWVVHYEIPPYGYSRFGGAFWFAFPTDSSPGGFKATADPDGSLWSVDDEGRIINFDGIRETILPWPFSPD
jgi:hypothetical protein